MARLPQPGGDQGNWGDILNDYLSVAHNADGTLKTSPSVADADGSTKGKVQLAGDLGGTAASPQVTSTSLSAPLPIDQGGTGATTSGGAINALLPSQTGNNGKVLTTNGTTPSWSAAGSGVSDHGALSGLSDDDHPQYALADGSRGDFDANGAAASAETNAINAANTALDTHKITNDHKFYLHSIRAETSADLSAYTGSQTIDGVTASVGDRVLSTNDGKVYEVQPGTWTIDTDYNTEGVIFIIGEGTANKGHIWRVNNSGSSVGYTASGILDANARVNVKKTGTSIGTRRSVNFIEGTNITISTTDDSINEAVNVTVSASGGATGLNLNHYYNINSFYLLGTVSTTQSASGITLTANQFFANRIVILEDCEIGGGFFFNSANTAGGLFRYGIYAVTAAGIPTGAPLLQSPEIDLSTSAYKSSTWTPVTLTAGPYAVGYWSNAAAALRKCTVEPLDHGSADSTSTPYLGYAFGSTNTYSSSGMPTISSLTGTLGLSGSISRPYIMFKVTG